MKTITAAAFLLFGLAHPAQALDNSAAVKVTPLLKTSTSWDGKPIVYPQGRAEITALVIEIAPGGETGWHEHPVPSFAYVLEGTLEVKLANGAVKVLRAGETLPEVVSTLHSGRALGAKPVKLFVLYTGTADQKLTIAHPDFAARPATATPASPAPAPAP